MTEYEIVVTKKGPKRVEVNIKIGDGPFAPLTHFAFEDHGTEGVVKVMEEKSGQYVPRDVVGQARNLAIKKMIEERRL